MWWHCGWVLKCEGCGAWVWCSSLATKTFDLVLYYEDLRRKWTIEQSALDYIDKLEYTNGKGLDPSGFQIFRNALVGQVRRGRMAKCFLEHLKEMFVELEKLELDVLEREC
jgi:hypothetical protein